jgi:hypothetical protein
LIAAFSLSVIAAFAHAHGDAEWIMRGENSWCCGPKDCFEIEHSDVRHIPAGEWSYYQVKWRGRTFDIPESEAKRSEPMGA